MENQKNEASYTKQAQCLALCKSGYQDFEESNETEEELNYIIQAEQLHNLISIRKIMSFILITFLITVFISFIFGVIALVR